MTNDTPTGGYIHFDEEANVFRVWLLTTSINTTNQNYDIEYNKVMNISGTAELITTFDNN